MFKDLSLLDVDSSKPFIQLMFLVKLMTIASTKKINSNDSFLQGYANGIWQI